MIKGDSTSSARIRENQRRSRARRKEYVQHLEQRLRAYERLGVTATKEVQEAGREVAAENILLRSLLSLHGVTEDEIEEHLKSQRPFDNACAAQPSATSRTRSAASASAQSLTAPSESLSGCRRSSANPFFPESATKRDEDVSAESQDALPNEHPLKGCEGHNINLNGLKDNPEALRRIASQPVSKMQRLDGQSMSCEAAARIITSMRDYLDIQDVRSQLGCSSEASCIVRNMSIFDHLDRE